MSDNEDLIFRNHAPAHWAAGLPVIPLKPRQKMPAPNSWQAYAAMMPTDETKEGWMASYPDGNMGLPLGPQSGLIAIDLDSEDPRVAKVLDELLPPTPWTRVGKKGSIRVYRYTEEKTSRIKDADNKTLVEILSRGTQMVLPPSIHPDTQLPYIANCPLVDVLDRVVPLPRDFEVRLRQGMIDAGIKLSSRGSVKVTQWVPSGGRDSALVALAGLQARGVVKGERTLIEALNEVEAWVVNFTENISGDAMDPQKARDKVMEFVRRDVMEHGRVLPQGWDLGLTDGELIEMKKFFGETVEEWSIEQYLEHLSEKFSEIPKENQASRASVIEDTLARLAKSQHMNDLQYDIVLQYIHNGNGRMLTMASMRKRIRELKGKTMTGDDHTEIAQHLIAELERYGEMRFDGGLFYQWAGSHWKMLPEHTMLGILAREFGKLAAAKRNTDHKGILNVTGNLLPRGLKAYDIMGINFANGFLTLDMELKPHDPAYGARYVLPYRYMPNEGAPLRFLAFLDQAWGQDEDYMDKVQALREAMAVTLFGMAPRYSRAFCLFGPPKTGKSTLKDIVQGMFPDDSICTVPPHDWADKFIPTQMLGKQLNFCGELSEKEMIAGDRFKSIVEGEELNGQFKGGQIFKFKPMCAHWFASNHLPRTRDTSAGFNRRWLFLHFERRVSDAQKIVKLAEQILAEEREAIATWAVPAIEDILVRQEYTLPISHARLISEVASQNNSIRFFLTSGGIQSHAPSDNVDSSPRTSEKELYGLYYAFCKVQAGAMPVQLKRFRLIMQELQEEIGFVLRIEKSPAGEEAWYDYLTPVRTVGYGTKGSN